MIGYFNFFSLEDEKIIRYLIRYIGSLSQVLQEMPQEAGVARARSPGAKPETDTRYGKLHQQPTTRGDEARGQPERQGKWGERDRTHVGHQLR